MYMSRLGWQSNGVFMARIALSILFFWFGILKFFPGLSVAEDLAGRTSSMMTMGDVHPQIAVPVLAAWECAIGLGFLSGKYIRATLFLQLPGTFLPLLYFPHEAWHRFPYAPTLEGQYIIKNLALIASGMLVGATMRGGCVIADPRVAAGAAKVETIYERFRRRFGREPEPVRIRTKWTKESQALL